MSGQVSRVPEINAYDRIVEQTKFTHRLLSVHWEVTYRCNERCTHCYLDVMPPGAKVPGELTTDEAKRVIDELAALGALTITFSGGEVFVRDDIFELSQYARRRGFAIRYFTNGILVNEKVADQIAAIRPVLVEVSMYSADPLVHDNLTQVPGSWELTWRAVELLRERNIRVLMKTPLMRENIDDFDALLKMAESYDARFQYDTTIIPKHTGDPTPLQHRPTDDQMLNFMRTHSDTSGLDPIEVGDNFRFCSIGLNSLTISPYGEIYTCVGARVSAGNLRQSAVTDLWKTSPVWEDTGGLTIGNLPVCATCELRAFCVRCHGTAAIEDGDFLGCSSAAYREARLRRQAWREMKDNGLLSDNAGSSKGDYFGSC